uniref:Uncharacterized protein n=1 Tax=Arundo donax TaxID=35708 RepID=A0A0A9DWJ0_ARUDO
MSIKTEQGTKVCVCNQNLASKDGMHMLVYHIYSRLGIWLPINLCSMMQG